MGAIVSFAPAYCTTSFSRLPAGAGDDRVGCQANAWLVRVVPLPSPATVSIWAEMLASHQRPITFAHKLSGS